MARRVQGVIRRSPLAAGAQAVTIWQSVPFTLHSGLAVAPQRAQPIYAARMAAGPPPPPARPSSRPGVAVMVVTDGFIERMLNGRRSLEQTLAVFSLKSNTIPAPNWLAPSNCFGPKLKLGEQPRAAGVLHYLYP
jgi:hypothetical protein